MKYPYAYEAFTQAISLMATSPETLNERIGNAYINHLLKLKSSDLPEEIRYRFESLSDKLTRVEPSGVEGRVMATLKRMSIGEAIEVAQEILSMAAIVKSRNWE